MNGLDFFLGVLSGIVVGYVIQLVRYKHDLRVEKIKRLAPHLELAYPIVDRSSQDSEYTVGIQNRKDEKQMDAMLEKLTADLSEYHFWYTRYQENGLKPELRSVNEILDAYLNGLFVYSQLSKMHGKSYIHQRLSDLAKHLMLCKLELERLLMG